MIKLEIWVLQLPLSNRMEKSSGATFLPFYDTTLQPSKLWLFHISIFGASSWNTPSSSKPWLFQREKWEPLRNEKPAGSMVPYKGARDWGCSRRKTQPRDRREPYNHRQHRSIGHSLTTFLSSSSIPTTQIGIDSQQGCMTDSNCFYQFNVQIVTLFLLHGICYVQTCEVHMFLTYLFFKTKLSLSWEPLKIFVLFYHIWEACIRKYIKFYYLLIIVS